MVVTFQILIDSLDDSRIFTRAELLLMEGLMNEFASRLEEHFKEYITTQMYVNGKTFESET